MKRKIFLAGVIASFLALASVLNGPANAQIGIGRTATELILSGDLTVGGQILAASGALGAPGVSFTDDPDGGMWNRVANELNFSVNGSEEFRITATVASFFGTSIRIPLGAVTAPSLNFTSTTGLFEATLGGADGFGMAQGGKDLGSWYVVTGEIGNAALKILSGTPVEVIGAPGSGKAIIVESSRFMLEHTTADFDGVAAGEDLVVEYSGGLDLQTCDNSTCLDAAASADAFGYVLEPTTALGSTPVDNAAVDLAILNGEWFASTGGGSLHYHIRYRVVTLDLS